MPLPVARRVQQAKVGAGRPGLLPDFEAAGPEHGNVREQSTRSRPKAGALTAAVMRSLPPHLVAERRNGIACGTVGFVDVDHRISGWNLDIFRRAVDPNPAARCRRTINDHYALRWRNGDAQGDRLKDCASGHPHFDPLGLARWAALRVSRTRRGVANPRRRCDHQGEGETGHEESSRQDRGSQPVHRRTSTRTKCM
jgi:hypothetical protein